MALDNEKKINVEETKSPSSSYVDRQYDHMLKTKQINLDETLKKAVNEIGRI